MKRLLAGQVVEFEPAALGIMYGAGNRVLRVRPGSQAERLGVRTGWRIKSVNGAVMRVGDAHQAVADALAVGVAAGGRLSLVFEIPPRVFFPFLKYLGARRQ